MTFSLKKVLSFTDLCKQESKFPSIMLFIQNVKHRLHVCFSLSG